ncbi:FAR1 DNA binding domain - like 6 [Theobroma cacao]|nr:FAR1 DNA binding domain - like 6 [Theobroma cacao]
MIEFYSRRLHTCEGLKSRTFACQEGYVTIGCDREGIYRDRDKIPIEKKQRASCTHLINCPFALHVKRQSDGFWVLHLRNASHNHEPSSNMSAHPFYGRLKREEIVDIEKLSISGIQSR